jgi:small subunit ribosomal protein S3
MGQKTNPIGNRLGIIRGWESNWYGNKKDYANKLIEDNKIRNYLNARINKGGIAKIVIERTRTSLVRPSPNKLKTVSIISVPSKWPSLPP